MSEAGNRLRRLLAAALIAVFGVAPAQTLATVVQFETVLGNFRVNLFDNVTPVTVANFLDYVNNGAYTDSFIHRSEPGFVIQGGGFTYDGSLQFSAVATSGAIPANAAIVNEPELTNARGTIAMAKLGGDPDSATNQWFINLDDNAANLDGQNGGFSVFGVVIEDGQDGGMDVVDAIAALDRENLGGAFATLPVLSASTGAGPDASNLVIVNSIVVLDTTVDTGADLLPATNVTANPPPAPTPAPVVDSGGGGGGGGGAPGLVFLAGLAVLVRLRVTR
ncbi:MAG: peptidylprolyl isomerase [Pseudomonadota bacterium]